MSETQVLQAVKQPRVELVEGLKLWSVGTQPIPGLFGNNVLVERRGQRLLVAVEREVIADCLSAAPVL